MILRWLVQAVFAAVALAAATLAGHGAGPTTSQPAPAAIVIQAQPVYRGCNSIVVTAPLATKWADIVAHFSAPGTVLGVWQYDNALQRYHGVYFPGSNAPTDGNPATAGYVTPLFICVTTDGAVS